MTDAKIKLDKEIVKYIFPGARPKVILGEDGWVAYDFERMIPENLGIVIPTEVDASNCSQAFPKSFEAYFKNLQEKIEYFSRLIEAPIELNIPMRNVEAIVGGVIAKTESGYTIFRFDEMMEATDRSSVLCRARADKLSINELCQIINAKPIFIEDTTTFGDAGYVYWIMPIKKLFKEPRKVLAATFNYLGFLQ